jgi:hypothetical protein
LVTSSPALLLKAAEGEGLLPSPLEMEAPGRMVGLRQKYQGELNLKIGLQNFVVVNLLPGEFNF